MADTVVDLLIGSALEPFTGTFAHWNGLRGGEWAPAADDFFIDSLDPGIIPWSVLIDVDPSAHVFSSRFWGTERARLIGAEMTGKSVADIPDHKIREGNISEYKQVVRERQPMLFETPVTTKSGSELRFQSIRLPLAGADGALRRIFSVLNYEAVIRRHYEHYGTQVPGARRFMS